jgi:lantibiotic biosynthesis protein
MNASRFRTLDFFMLRTPLLPLSAYQSLPMDREEAILQLAAYAEDPVVRESILVASQTLADALPAWRDTNDLRKREQLLHGFLRYWLRMTTRPTPFGLFSGVAAGRFGESSQLAIQSREEHQTRTRPDMEWLMQVVDRLEADPRVIEQLEVQVSTMVYRQGTRLVIPYVTRYGQKLPGDSRYNSASVRCTPVVEMVMEAAQGLTPFRSLCEGIHTAYAEANPDVIRSFLLQLLQQEVLITSLRPPTTIASPLAHLLSALQQVTGIEAIRERLLSIESKLNRYDQLPLGAGESLLREIRAEMTAIAPSDTPLQADMKLAADDLQLPHSVSHEVARAADLLWRLQGIHAATGPLDAYRAEFLEKYGLSREVPLLELLDEEQGLGAPAGYLYPASGRNHHQDPPANQKRQDRVLFHWVTAAVADRRLELELNEEHLRALLGEDASSELPPLSLELYFTLTAASQAALEAGEFRLVSSVNPGSSAAGKTFGRFADLLGDEFVSCLQQIQEVEHGLQPEPVIAEVAYLPLSGRATNIVLAPNIRPYEIPLGTASSCDLEATLALDDLVVGSNANQLYLKSRRLNREVWATAGHMLNPMLAPNVCRFLLEVSQARRRKWMPFDWGAAESSPFLPRLRYGRIVLSPARWRLETHNGDFQETMSDEAWKQALADWRARWQVPRHVYLTQADNRLLLDLEHDLHLAQIRKELFKRGDILLVEQEAGFDEYPVQGPEGRLVGEFVFPLVRTQSAPATDGPRNAATSPIPGAVRSYLPGSEWLYAKLYGGSNRQDELIGGELKEFCQKVMGEGLADGSYFIRYQDTEPHLRLRFHGQPARLAGELLPRLSEWSAHLQNQGLLTRFVLDTYEPETERYGGPALIGGAERLFAADSATVAHLVSLLRFGKMSMPAEKVAVLSLVDYLSAFGLTLEKQFQWLDLQYGHKEFLEEFRPQRGDYLKLLSGHHDNDRPGLLAHPDGQHLAQVFAMRRPAVQQYAAAVRAAEAQGEAANRPDDILASVLHMHINRLLGIDRARERKVMILARHALNSLLQFQKNRNKE